MSTIAPQVLRKIADRQALLWVCQKYDLREGEEVHGLDLPSAIASLRYRKEPSALDRQIASLYWEAVWLEGAKSPVLAAFRSAADGPNQRRSVILLSSPTDVDARVPVEEFLPVRVLPGVIDSTAPLDAQYGTAKARVRERVSWSFASQLQQFRGHVLIVLGALEPSDLDRLFQVLEDVSGLELTILVAWPQSRFPESPRVPNVEVAWFLGSDEDLISSLAAAGAPLATQLADWSIRVGTKVVNLGAKDVRHILTRFSLLTERDVRSPSQLEMEDLHAFLRGDLNTWNAYGAGLPVPRSYRTGTKRDFTDEIEALLGRLSRGEDDSFTTTVQLPAEGGSGTTTLLRGVAYRMAAAGYPTLVLRPEQVDIDLDHVLAFSDALSERLSLEGIDQQPPILMVCDVEHSGIANLKQVTQLLATRSRRILLLQAIKAETRESEEKRTRRFVRLPILSAESDETEVRACQEVFSTLATRWNLPVEPKSAEDWRGYQAATRWRDPGNENVSSLFWVALRFFLVEGFSDEQRDNLDRAVGAWIDKRTDAVTDPSMKRLLDFTAVLSSFRIGAPIWTVLRPITGGTFSSAVVDSLRSTQDVVVWGPQVEELGDQTIRFAHPALAEHYLVRKGIRDTNSKLAVIEPVISSLSGGHPADVWLAENVVTDILVPDYLGRRQFDWEWRIEAFNQIPPLVRDQSKAILHHWARVLYQSADEPGMELAERRERISRAIEKLQAAIKLPRRGARDEHPSHLYNTLGTAFARYARLLEQTDPHASSNAWNEARRAFQEAINLGGGINVEALLAFSLRLIDHAEQPGTRDRAEAASDIAYALDLLDEAETALGELASPDPELEEQLIQYRARGLNWLERGAGWGYIRELQRTQNSDLGFYCESRLQMGNGVDPSAIDRALNVLVIAKQRGVNLQPRSLRLYFILLRRHPQHRFDFAEQKQILQALENAAGTQMRPTDAFTHAVLCYQLELYVEGADRFRKLREQTAKSGNAPPRMREIWRDRQNPEKPRVTQLKVTRVLGEWRGEAFIYEIGQKVPVRPRHFSPALKLNDVAECVIRFEFFGPLAVPRRFEEAATRQGLRES